MGRVDSDAERVAGTLPIVRAAMLSDVAAVRALEARWEREQSVLGFSAASSEEITARVGHHFAVAEIDGALVGHAWGRICEVEDEAVWRETDRHYLEIEDLYVVPEYRRRGVGSAMFHWLDRRAQAEGVERIKLYSASQPIDGVLAFYEALGLRPWYVVMVR